MNAWYFLCFLSAVSVFIAFANQYLLRLQTTIAITTGSVAMSLLLMALIKFGGNDLAASISEAFQGLNFNLLLLKGMLGFLLFAGALEIDLHLLRQQRWEITIMALFSTLLSTVLIGYASFWVLGLLGWNLPLIYCMLFGALISPTDPIAVLAIIKKMNAPEKISVQVEGESLFNDGVGLVVFTTIFALAFSGAEPTFSGVAELFLVDAVGGIVFGAVLAFVAHWCICRSNDSSIELLITLCIPSAGYALANVIDVSGPLAMVVSGIVIGNITRTVGFSEHSQFTLSHFWHTVDAFLNALLFLLIGLMLVILPVSWTEIGLGLVMIPLVLLARFASVAVPYIGFKRFRTYDAHAIKILTWGGLRGGLALAMAASIPKEVLFVNGVDYHTLLLMMTYVVVIFSIVVQGSTIAPLIKRSIEAQKSA
ncbi:MAG: sodium:proton antiporter [Pseudomonadota bacterium]|jgi:monovalent cation:H+ antiporter, CPA1 family|uniref:NhaP-type Na+/H+ and K+/H+ antiporter n=1 Tax=Methylophaga aminisulfidivorans MP TaxID=1026882 RepID=F5SXG2_9GAMM|nr:MULTISPECIES: sodium:proton antiporter [Methylophaga]EGL55094.1 nhaP-type Na+/H+ and K+/H+ antiporter [Methylophaga aminisulfidivorans MP]MEC9411254.1 sodium:proton antiporter [Pseudomonadota bacterium]HIC45712.1 sodium:proton antiporter [Methylophaga sp.]HIM39666.1 sodium:proton antiporter [Methylophaga aminisulfidivorans]